MNLKPNVLRVFFLPFILKGKQAEASVIHRLRKRFNFWIGPEENSLLCVLIFFALKSFSLVGFARSFFPFSYFSLKMAFFFSVSVDV